MHDDALIEGIDFGYKPVDTSPLEPCINNNRLSSDRIGILIKEISVPGDLPFRSRTLCRFLYDFIILGWESECIIVKLLLELVHVSKRIFHGRQLILLTDLIQALLALSIRLVSHKEVLKHFPVHKPALLDCCCIIASQQQSEEILKIPGYRVNIIAGQIFRTDRKDDLIKTLSDAEMNAVYASPTDDFGQHRRAEIIALLFSAYETNMRKIQFGSEIAVQVIHRIASLVVLVMLQEDLDILDIHLGDDFPGTAESCDILVIAVHGISIKLVVRFISCSLQCRHCLCHLSQKLQRKTRCTVTLGMIRDWVLVQFNNHSDQLPSYKIHLQVYSFSS